MTSLQSVAVVGMVILGLVVGAVLSSDAFAHQPSDATQDWTFEFEEVSRESGFRYNTTERSGIISDAGVYVADYNQDGWPDLLAIGGPRPVLFRNDGGTFTRSGQLDQINRTIRVAIFLDYDTDGDDDLVLFPWEGTPVVLQNRDGTLEPIAGVLDHAFERPVGAAAGDYNRDGCLDLFVIQNGDWSDRLPEGAESAAVPTAEDNGNPNRLYEGTCDAFRNTTRSAGIEGSTWSLATSMVDLDADGYPDIHVANDFNNDVIYWNEGDGSFTRTVLPNETNRNAMASEVEDFTGDRRLDLFVTNIHLPSNVSGETVFVAEGRTDGNNLLVNRGNRRFVTHGDRCGVRKGGWGWSSVGADLENDGDVDIFHTTLEFTGYLGRELLGVRQRSPHYSFPVLFEHRGGARCEFRTANASVAGFETTDGHGVAQLDFDRDGNLDIAMAVSPGPTGEARFRLYKNTGDTGRAVQVRIDDAETVVSGTRVVLSTGEKRQVRVLHSRTDYFSQDSRILHFGMGSHPSADLQVIWPDGTTSSFSDVEAGNRLVLSRDGIERRIPLDGTASGSPSPLLSGFDLLLLIGALTTGLVLFGGLFRRRLR